VAAAGISKIAIGESLKNNSQLVETEAAMVVARQCKSTINWQ